MLRLTLAGLLGLALVAFAPAPAEAGCTARTFGGTTFYDFA